jgi:hypothetical protein
LRKQMTKRRRTEKAAVEAAARGGMRLEERWW